MSTFSTTIPLSLYVHIPWCVRKCPYCDFNSHEARHAIPEELYVKTLLRDLDEQLIHVKNRPLISIFFGGGTPSLFTPQSIEKILAGVEQRVGFAPSIEITLEANPGTVDQARFTGFREAGINRLSIGIQSLQNEKLQSLGRIHDRDHAIRAVDAAISAGFDRFNLDLMHGLPGQSIDDALQDLNDALAFQPPHLSWYQLTIEPNTFFHHTPPVLPPDETLWEIQEQGQSVLQHAGLNQYEVSAYAKQGHECIHNTHYWEFGDYLGIGAGAHSKLTDTEKQLVYRHAQTKNPRDYLNPEKKLTASHTILTEKDLCFEFMLNALRLKQGVSSELFVSRTGLSLSALEPALSIAKEKQLMIKDVGRLCATELGQRFLNDLLAIMMV